MKNILVAIAIIIAAASCNVQTGSGNVISENREVGDFRGVQASGSIDVEVETGPEPQVTIEADDNIMKYIITEIDNGVLKIHYKSNISFRDVHVKAHVIAKEFNRLSVSGSGNISSLNTVGNTDRFRINVSGSGNVNADIDAPKVETDISGSGTITLRGRCKSIEAEVSGSGDLNSKDLLSENANVSIGGSGTASIYCSVSLTARVSGSGNVYYSGNPKEQHIDKSGSGNIEKR